MNPDVEISGTGEIETIAARWVARRDAGLSPAEERELQRWVDADKRHQRALGFYDSAWSALARPSRLGAGAELEHELGSLAGRRRRRRAVMATASALLVALGLGLATWRFSSPRPSVVAPTAVLVMPMHQTLPDGSVVELKGNALIAVDYSAAMRRVLLKQGEAHFAVQKDPGRPFVVSAGGIEVRAVGTAFSVQLGVASVDVLVTSGHVALDRTAGSTGRDAPPAAPPFATLAAGSRAVVQLGPSPMEPEVSNVLPGELSERLAWRSPRLEFTRAPLADAVALLNLHAPPSSAKLVIADAKVAATTVSGIFRPDNTDAFVVLLEGAFGVRAERSGSTITLHLAR